MTTDKGAKASHVTDSPAEDTVLRPRGDGRVTAPLSEATINHDFFEDEEGTDALLEASEEQVTECESTTVCWSLKTYHNRAFTLETRWTGGWRRQRTR